jgi:hypothetical protein
VIIVLYLAAIVAANLLAAECGPSVTPYTAFALIGFDLVARDRLHDEWRGNPLRLGALIAAGSLLSYLINADAGRIALASCVAFAAAALVDWVVYRWRQRSPWMERSNASNLASAAVDSVVFPTHAFGVWLWPVIAAQFFAKAAGGVLWSLVLAPIRRRAATRHYRAP